jgi:hypothetical protein
VEVSADEHARVAIFRWRIAAEHGWIQARDPGSGGALVIAADEDAPDAVPYLAEIAGPRRWEETLDAAPDAFLNFADLGSDRERIAAFANERGLLGVDTARLGFVRKLHLSETVPAEPLETWVAAIAEMRRAVVLRGAVLDGDPSPAAIIKRIAGDGDLVHVELPDGDAFRVTAGAELSTFKAPDPVLLARIALQRKVNEALDRYVRVRVLIDLGASVQAPHVAPGTLLGALWWQLAESLADREVRFTRCAYKGCGRFMACGPNRRRKHALTCSPACRRKKHRGAQTTGAPSVQTISP